jgi:hypothetical protein
MESSATRPVHRVFGVSCLSVSKRLRESSGDSDQTRIIAAVCALHACARRDGVMSQQEFDYAGSESFLGMEEQ